MYVCSYAKFFFIEISVIFLFMMILLDECSMLKLILSLFDDDFFCSWIIFPRMYVVVVDITPSRITST
jgi:hypothetical protein